jgi:hypothetical protein
MEVTPTQLLALLREGTAPLKARSAIARGALPLPPAPLLEALDILADDPEPGVQEDAARTLEQLPAAVVRGVATSSAAAPALLDRLSRRYALRESVALDLARNAATDEATAAFLATLPFPVVLEVLGHNQGLLERSPETVAALFANPATPMTVMLLWQEHQDRRGAARPEPAFSVAGEAEPAAADAAFAPELTEDDEEPGDESVRSLATDADGVLSARQLSIYSLLKKMSMGQKVALAVKGNREVRNLLIRETNKMLCLKVLENPRISDTDVEAYAKSTNLSEDVLRGIANKKEWCKKYGIVKALVQNPKAPLGVTLDFIKRLSLKDVEQLSKNRNVPETLRSAARRIHALKRDANR